MCFIFFVAKVAKYRYKVLWDNVSSSFPDYNEAQKKHIISSFYAWLCDYFVETIKLLTMSKAEIKRRMIFTRAMKWINIGQKNGL